MATKKPTAAQLRARAKFAAMAKSGAFARKRKAAANPIKKPRVAKTRAKARLAPVARKTNPKKRKVEYFSSPNRGLMKYYMVRDESSGQDVAQFGMKSEAIAYGQKLADRLNIRVSVRSV